MHKFQPFSIEMLQVSPFEHIGERQIMLASGNREKSNLTTLNWGSLGPVFGMSCINIYVKNSRFTKEFLDKNLFFSISTIKPEYASALEYCGKISGRNENKWKRCGLTQAFRHGIPYPDEAEVVLLCQCAAAVPINEENIWDKRIIPKCYEDNDFHTMYIGEIMEIMAR